MLNKGVVYGARFANAIRQLKNESCTKALLPPFEGFEHVDNILPNVLNYRR